MKISSFKEQLAVGQKSEHFIATLFTSAFKVEFAGMAQQRQGIDFIFTDRVSGAVRLVELKTDWTAAKTGNAFIETVSVDVDSKLGWVYTSRADWLLYYVPGLDMLYRINFDELRDELPNWLKWHPVRKIPNQGYNTHGLLVPLVELERIAADIVDVGDTRSCANCRSRLVRKGAEYCAKYKAEIAEGTDPGVDCKEFNGFNHAKNN